MGLDLVISLIAWAICFVLFLVAQGKKGIIKGFGGGFILGCLTFVGYHELYKGDRVIDNSGVPNAPYKSFAIKYSMENAKEKFNTEFLTLEITKYDVFQKKWGLWGKATFTNENGRQCKEFMASYTGQFGVGELKEIIKDDSIKDCE
jgi:hypothetical protein